MTPRAALAAAVAAVAFAASYTAQRLASWVAGEPDPDWVLAAEHIAYYWRVALALLHAAVAGLGVGLAAPAERLDAWLDRLPAAIAAVVGVCTLVLLAVP